VLKVEFQENPSNGRGNTTEEVIFSPSTVTFTVDLS